MSIFGNLFTRPTTNAKVLWSKGTPKGKVESSKSMWKKDYGEEHPFSMELVERAYKQVPIIHSAINKTVDQLTNSDYIVKSDNPQIETAAKDFLKRNKFDILLKNVAKDMMIFGNAYIENVGNFDKLRCLSPKFMFVKRDDYGTVEGFTQILSQNTTTDPIKFEKSEIIHFRYNVIGDNAYGYSIIAPILQTVEHKLNMEKIMVKLMERKANAPYWAKLGNEQQPATDADITNFSNDLQFLNERTEFVTSHNVEMNVLDVASKLPKFDEINNHIENQIVYGTEVPLVLLGQGSIPEGLASVQLEAFERRITSIRLQIETVIEENILRPYFDKMGLQGSIEFEFEPQSQTDKWKEIERLQLLLMSGLFPFQFNQVLMQKIASLMDMDEQLVMPINPFAPQLVNPLQQNPLAPQPNNPFAPKVNNPFTKSPMKTANPFAPKPMPNPFEKKESCDKCIHEVLKEDYELDEWIGRKTGEFLAYILKFLSKYTFPDVSDISNTQMLKIRTTMINGFQKGQSIGTIARSLATTVEDKDKALKIARTESTRVAAEAYLDKMEAAGIEKVRFVANQDSRLCPDCEELNGKVYRIDQARGMIPTHVNCRCLWTAVI